MKPSVRNALAVAALLLGGCSLTPSVRAIPRAGLFNVRGDVFVSSSGASASTDAETLGMDDDDFVPEPRVDMGWGPAHLMATAYVAEFEGTGRTEGQFDLGGVVIGAGEDVSSSLDVTSASVIGTFDFVPTGLVDLGIGLGARVLDFEGEIQSLSTGERIVTDETFLMPVGAARAAVGLGPVEVSVVGSGLTGSYGDVHATVLDLDLMGEYAFDDFLGFHGGLVVGYRYIAVDVEYDDGSSEVDTELDFDGPYVGISLGN